MTYDKKIQLVPVWEKATLSLDEATAYTGLGRDKLVEMANEPKCEFVLWVGSKRLFKRKKLDEFIEKTFSL